MIEIGKSCLPTLSSATLGAKKVGEDYTTGMTSDISTLGGRLRYAREAAGLTQSSVAAEFKISRVSVLQWEQNQTKPEADRFPILALLYGTTIDWLLDSKGNPPLVNPDRKTRRHAEKVAPPVAGTDLIGSKDLPIYAAAMGGNGHTIIGSEAVDYVKRPSSLQNVRGGYGILIVGESMVPAYWPGDMALVNPLLPSARDSDVILYHTPPDGHEAEAMIKRLIGINDRDWTLEQYRPAKEFKISRVEWPICHRIVGRYNAR